MTWFADGNQCIYFGVRSKRLIAAGWLESFAPYASTRMISSSDLRALRRVPELIETFQPMRFMGYHRCSLCGKEDGLKNLFVPAGDRLWVAPEMILHYVERHQYSPPVEFMAALHAAFDQGLEAYKENCKAAWARASVDRDPVPVSPPFFVHLLVRLTGDGAPQIIHLLPLGSYPAEADLPLWPAAEIMVEQEQAGLCNVTVHDCLVNGTPQARHAAPLALKNHDRIEFGPLRYVYLRASNWMP